MVCEEIEYTCFPLHLENIEKDAHFLKKKINLFFSHTPNWIYVGIFANIYSYLFDMSIKKNRDWKCRSKSAIAVSPFHCKYMTHDIIKTSYILTLHQSYLLYPLPFGRYSPTRKITKLWPWKWKSRSRSRTELAPFDWNSINPYVFQNFSFLTR